MTRTSTESEPTRNEADQESRSTWSRRGFLRTLGGAAGVGVLGTGSSLIAPSPAKAEVVGPVTGSEREVLAFERRLDAALFHYRRPAPIWATNGDDERYPSRIGSFSKTLPHNDRGEVDTAAYDAFLVALTSGEAADFDAIPAGGTARLANPRAANAYVFEGADPHKIDMPAVHTFDSARQAAEAAEVYWHALARDVPFDQYDSDATTLAAAADLSGFSDFTGPRSGGQVTPATLFRGQTPGDNTGPYISQFLYLGIPYGNRINRQAALNPVAGVDFMADEASWLAVQRGQGPTGSITFETMTRYIQTARDLGEYVHSDYTYQAYLNASLIALGLGSTLDPNPYSVAAREGGFVTFGPAAIWSAVGGVALAALKVAWVHKWLIHRKLRPEAFGGRVHQHLTGGATYPIHPELLGSPALPAIFGRNGNYLLPQAFPEGSPTHPSYPAGHATIAGACVTVLKAFFDESFEFPRPVVPRADGRRLVGY